MTQSSMALCIRTQSTLCLNNFNVRFIPMSHVHSALQTSVNYWKQVTGNIL